MSYILKVEQEERIDKFEDFRIDDYKWKDAYQKIHNFIISNYTNFTANNNLFDSWIDVDYWLCGLIFWILFEKKTIITADNRLFEDIKSEIGKARNKYSKTPNQLGNLRERMKKSIEIYSRYVQE